MGFLQHGYEHSGGNLRDNSKKRFWVPKSDQGSDPVIRKVIILDDPPALLWEHNPQIGGNFQNYYTCVQGLYGQEACPLCQYSIRHKDGNGRPMYGRYRVGVFSIIEVFEWKDRDGNPRKNLKRLLVVKGNELDSFKHRASQRDGLAGTMWEVVRTKKSPAIGNQWDFMSQLSEDEIQAYCPDHDGADIKPYDYEKEFHPGTVDELQGIASSLDGGSYESGPSKVGAGTKVDEEPPF